MLELKIGQDSSFNWRVLAKCRGKTRLFYSDDKIDIIKARALCLICPVRKSCLAECLVYLEDEGVWGGESEKSRKYMMLLVRKSFLSHPAA